MNADRERN